MSDLDAALDDLDDLLADLPAQEREKRKSMLAAKRESAVLAPSPAPVAKAESQPEPPKPAVDMKPKEEPASGGGGGLFGSDFMFALKVGMAKEDLKDDPAEVRQLSPRSLLKSFTFGGDENAEIDKVAAEPSRRSTMVPPSDQGSPAPAPALAAVPSITSSSRTTIMRSSSPTPASSSPSSAPSPAPAAATATAPSPAAPGSSEAAGAEGRERMATIRQTMSAALVGLESALQGLQAKPDPSPRASMKPLPPVPAAASTSAAVTPPRTASPAESSTKSKFDEDMKKMEEDARKKTEASRQRAKEEEKAKGSDIAKSDERISPPKTASAAPAAPSVTPRKEQSEPEVGPDLRYDNPSEYKKQMLEKYELQQLENAELLKKKKEELQLQLQEGYSLRKEIKVDPEETLLCMCYNNGKVLLGSREGSLIVIDCKSYEVVEYKQKVHTGMVNSIASVGTTHIWSAADDGSINIWERKSRSAAGHKDRQTQKDLSLKPAQGFLTKQGIKVKNWKVRWFVMEEESLHYYERKEDKIPKGSINLVGAKLEKLAVKDKKFHFSIMPARSERTYYIFAASEEEREGWLGHIAAAIKATEQPLFVNTVTKKMKFGIVSLVPLGNSVAIGCKEPVIHFWDANTYARDEIKLNLGEFKTANPMVSKIIKYRQNKSTLSPRGVRDPSQAPWVLWAVIDTAIVRLDVQKRQQIDVLKTEHERGITDLCETALGHIATASRDKLVLWDAESGRALREFDIEMPLVYSLMPTGHHVWVAGFNAQDKEVIRVYDSEWKLVKELNAEPVQHSAAITSLLVTTQEAGMLCWSASKDSIVCVWGRELAP